LVFDLSPGKAYVRKDRVSQIRNVEGIIFDCDGVLVDIRESYNRAISKSVAYILRAMTGCVLPENLIPDEIIYGFRGTGGFNNDWDTVYGIIMFTLSSLPREIRKCLASIIEKIGSAGSPRRRLMLLKDAAEKETALQVLNPRFFVELTGKLREFTGLLDRTGRRSVDKALAEIHRGDEDFRRFYGLIQRFLHPAEEVGKSVISAVFEEFFCGASLFREVYGKAPEFNNGPGLIENESLIVRPETLDSLISILGKRNLGIASGSRRKSAEYVLGNLIEKFNPEAMVFAETVEMAEREHPRGTSLKKPHPFSFLKAAEGFGDCSLLMYVGDSAEDVLMASEAAKIRGGVLFTGVYSYLCVEEEKLRGFLDHSCDMVIPSVNELPVILKKLGRRES
jgi:phosphoglycolate phosphatase-like HAD superfamily hydrolase